MVVLVKQWMVEAKTVTNLWLEGQTLAIEHGQKGNSRVGDLESMCGTAAELSMSCRGQIDHDLRHSLSATVTISRPASLCWEHNCRAYRDANALETTWNLTANGNKFTFVSSTVP